ncbi:hypothetical protein BKA66DRAFT_437577 [Pyrenochaeta sp. MPI-SDFR-AT-0127]|nr:hypothetical protein BKA66DRAFT_437577 [Pyrenochaeta sp. MPI-SDFR-AT-0127]
MTEPASPSTFETQLDAVEKLLAEGALEECIAEAKKTLSDPTLPFYYIIKNCISIFCASDDWGEAELWKLRAEWAYNEYRKGVARHNRAEELEILSDLRFELDQLDNFRRAEYGREPGDAAIELEMEERFWAHIAMEDAAEEEALAKLEMEDGTASESDDSDAVAQTENEGLVAAETILPIRSVSEGPAARSAAATQLHRQQSI